MLSLTPRGLYCAAGDFYVDPCKPVPRAVITHAHGDHARRGSGSYWCASSSLRLLQLRLGLLTQLRPVPYGQPFSLGPVRLSLHPAGHILGSAQVRMELDGQVWVLSGDFKRAADPTCAPFEAVPCDVFVTEATFARPEFRWAPTARVIKEVVTWWRANRERGCASVLVCYALGKAQRLLAELRPLVDDEPVLVDDEIERLVEVYRAADVRLARTLVLGKPHNMVSLQRSLVLLSPPTYDALRSKPSWLSRLGDREVGFVSGWMQAANADARKRYDRGFALSDHADWPALVETALATGARRVLTMHGQADALIAELRRRLIDATPL